MEDQPSMTPPPAPAIAPPARPGNGLAVAGFTCAVVGASGALVPVLGWPAVVLAVVGAVLSAIGLVHARRGASKKGLALAGVIVGAVAVVGGLIANIGFAAAVDDAVADLPAAVTPTPEAEDEAVEADAEPDPSPTPTPETVQPLALALVDTVFVRYESQDGWWSWAVVLDNPNPKCFFDLAAIDVEAFSAAGVLLDSDSDYVTLVPGQTGISGTFTSIGSETIDRLEVRGPDPSQAKCQPDTEFGTTTISDVAASSDRYSTTVAGNVTSTFGDDRELVEVTVIARNSAGEVIAIDSTYIDRLPAGGTARFEVSFLLQDLPADATFTAHIAL